MCHGAGLAAFPAAGAAELVRAEVAAWRFGETGARTRLAILPDIYGDTAFARGFATYLAGRGALVFLVDPFDGLGVLADPTREEAFARRHQVRDRAFVDAFEAFARAQHLTGTIGFCLGGLYVFELARRFWPGSLVGFYGFPQGLPNQDALPTPFDYLPDTTAPHTALLGAADTVVGAETVQRLAALRAPSMDLHVYPDSGHDFLRDLDSPAPELAAHARDALARCKAAVWA